MSHALPRSLLGIFTSLLTALIFVACTTAQPSVARTAATKTAKKERREKSLAYRGKIVRHEDQHLGLTAYVLVLDREMQFAGDDFVEPCVVQEIQLCPPDDLNLSQFLQSKVSVDGQLFGEHSAHHIRPVLLSQIVIQRES